MPEKDSKRRTLGEGKFLRLEDQDGWEFVERKHTSATVAVLAYTPAGELILTEQLRRAVGCRVIDLPAGLAGDDPKHPNEPIENAARRELVEEVGWDAKRLVRLARMPTSPGLASEVCTVFAAEELFRVSDGGGVDGEAIVVHLVTRADLDQFLQREEAKGALVDLKLYAALYLDDQRRSRG